MYTHMYYMHTLQTCIHTQNTYIHKCIHTDIHTYTYIRTCMHDIHTVHTYVPTYMHRYLTYMHASHAYIRIHVCYMDKQMHACITHTYTHIHTYVHACMHAYIHTYNTYVTCIHPRIYKSEDITSQTCMNTYIQTLHALQSLHHITWLNLTLHQFTSKYKTRNRTHTHTHGMHMSHRITSRHMT